MCRAALLLSLLAVAAHANPPAASYIFPAGGQRGKTVAVRVGGLFLHDKCGFEMLGLGIKANREIKRARTVWFEGPLLPLPDSQRQEDYPKDMAGQIDIAADAPLGLRHWRLWTSQGATPSMKFVVGDLPEIVEDEIDGDPIAVPVTLPLTINGRVFPREDIDVYSFKAAKGQTILCEVNGGRLGSPLEAHLDVLDSKGRRLTESDGAGDPLVRFTAPANGEYQVRIHDVRMSGGQAFVYRLTLTADPYVDGVYPLGGKRGDKLQLALRGQGVPAAPVAIALPATSGEWHTTQVEFAGKKTNPILLDVDDLPEHLETEANDDAGKSPALVIPAIFNGRIEKPGDVDWWAFRAKKGDVCAIDLRAARLGSPLHGVLRITDSAGKELARAEAGVGKLDPSLAFNAPADGDYRIAVEDRFRSRGGPAFAYRLRIDRPAQADFRLTLATDALTVPRKGEAKLKLQVERVGGFKDAIALSIEGLPAGVKVTNPTIAAGQAAVDLAFKADDAAPIKVGRVQITGEAKMGDKVVRRVASLPPIRGAAPVDTVLVAVALPTPFVIKGEYDMGFAARGMVHERKYKIERNGYDGPIEVSLTDKQARHLQGVTGPTIVVPAGASEFTYAAQLPPWMDMGRTCRVCVMGVGLIKDTDGSEHRVSFSSVNQNEQLIAVVGPGKLSIDLDRSSLIVLAGKSAALNVRIQRAPDVKGPVKIELVAPEHIRGIGAAPSEIPADRADGQLFLQAEKAVRGPLNMPLTIRATLMHLGRPIVAEAKIEVQVE